MSDIKQQLRLGASKGSANKTVFTKAIAHIEALEAQIHKLKKKKAPAKAKKPSVAKPIVVEDTPTVAPVSNPKKGFFSRKGK